LLVGYIVAQNRKTQQPNAAINPYSKVDKLIQKLPDSLTHNTGDIAKYIDQNFQNNSDKVRAVFIWVATNMKYDVDNMFAINFYAKEQDKIDKALKTRKGICENYAALFSDICLKCGMQSYVVDGYTKQNGFADYIPHAWCATKVDTVWYLFDPTWGSGYVNNSTFYPRINNEYFKAAPGKFIKSHMPFDPIWEFMDYPISNGDFYKGNVQQDKTKTYFNYVDSIKVYESLNQADQWRSSATRIEANGVKNAIIFERLNTLKKNIEIDDQNQKVAAQNASSDLYNKAVIDYNNGVTGLNTFISYRNNQFQPTKPDAEIQNMIDEPENYIFAAKVKLSKISTPSDNLRTLMISLYKSIDDILDHFKEQKDFLKEYLSKGKSGRKNMFYKTTFFGVPLK